MVSYGKDWSCVKISIDTEIMDIIIANTVTSDNMQVSLNQANAGDNIQSFIIFIAIGGIGSLLGNKLSQKDKNVGEGIEEYDI